MADKQLLELDCCVDSIVYHNENNGYTVIEADCGDETVTAVGIMPLVCEGEQLHLVGEVKSHPQYGRQFCVTTYEQLMPTTAIGILKYLSTGAIKGVGPATAARLVREFGENTLDVIKNNPDKVARLKGISAEKAQSMSDQLKNSANIRDLITYLGAFGVGAQEAISVYKNLGNEAMRIIEHNPFSLCECDCGISFETCDFIAGKHDCAPDSALRLRSALAYILNHNKSNGHTCLPQDKLIATAADYLSVELEKLESALNSMLDDGTLILRQIRSRDFIFLREMFLSESYIAMRLNMMLKHPPEPLKDSTARIKSIESLEGISYAELQKKAITEALTKGILVLTGGPGTGKTTTLKAIIKLLTQSGHTVLLAAPTGRAAQRMSDVTKTKAKTLHRLLEVQWDINDRPCFKRNERNPLQCNALVVDELSMVDCHLFESVIRALPLGCRLILVGDSDQLPSVGAGNLLADLINSGVIPVVALTEIFRQSQQSLIVTNAHSIVNGIMPNLERHDSDFFFLQSGSQEAVRNTIVSLCSERLPKSYGYSPLSDIQVLTPGRKGLLGTGELNQCLQSVLNPKSDDKKEIKIGFATFRDGDKVMQIKNNYDILWTKGEDEGEGIYNGDIGIIEKIDTTHRMLLIRFDDKLATYDADTAADLELSYACTVHKSQGNEFEAVVMPVLKNSRYLFYRNLLYTAVTRAKKLLILVGDRSTIEFMVNNNLRTLRYSGLSEFLSGGCDE